MIIDNGKISVIAPLSQPIVDPATGMPTKVFADFIFNMSLFASKTDSNSSNLVSVDDTVTGIKDVIYDEETGLEKAHSLINDEIDTRVDENEAVVERITTIEGAFETLAGIEDGTQALAAIGEEIIVRAAADSALSDRTLTLETTIGDEDTGLAKAHSLITDEASTRSDADEALAGRTSTLETTIGDEDTGLAKAHSLITDEASTRSDADEALAGRTSTLETTIGDEDTGLAKAHSLITDEASTRASADSANAGNISTLSAQVNHSTTGLPAAHAEITATNTVISTINDSFYSRTRDAAKALFDSGIYKITAFYNDSEPTADMVTGDLWFDTNDSNRVYRYDGTEWVLATDFVITSAIYHASETQPINGDVVVIFIQSSMPLSASIGDLWFDSDDDYRLYLVKNIISEWRLVPVDNIYMQPSQPSNALYGSIWFDTDDDYRAYCVLFGANSWSLVHQTYIQPSMPLNASMGDLWIDSDETYPTNIFLNKQYLYVYEPDFTDVSSNIAVSASAIATSVSSLSTTVADQTTTISEFSASINGIEGRWGVVINANGHMTGIQLIGSEESSSLVIDAEVLVQGSITTDRIQANNISVSAASNGGTNNPSFTLTTSGGTVFMIATANAYQYSDGATANLAIIVDDIQIGATSQAYLGSHAGATTNVPLVCAYSVTLEAGTHIFYSSAWGVNLISSRCLYAIELKR